MVKEIFFNLNSIYKIQFINYNKIIIIGSHDMDIIYIKQLLINIFTIFTILKINVCKLKNTNLKKFVVTMY